MRFSQQKRREVFLWATLFFCLGFFVVVPEFVLAQGLNNNDFAEVGRASGQASNLPLLFAKIIRGVLLTLGMIMVSLVVYGGVEYMLARGDKDKVKKAQKILKNAVIGLAIVLSSYAIATFVLNAVFRSAGIGRTVARTGTAFLEPLSGSLGSGIIEDHYPERNGQDVPRNTKIIVTFKEPMYAPSLTVDGQLNANNVKIYRTADGQNQSLASDEVLVAFTEDLKTFVFDPTPLLGSALETQNYTVFLSPNILKMRPDGVTTTTAFPPPFAGGYEWSFHVSTIVDVTPPQVQTVLPRPESRYDRNIVVQVSFNEPVDPTSTTGVHQPSVNRQFTNLQVRHMDMGRSPVEGTYRISNGYKTVEFVTFDQCGEDPCGGAIYCLPSNADLELFVRAATLGSEPPAAVFTSIGYDGVVDVAGNSLDGGGENGSLRDGIATGPSSEPNGLGTDNFFSRFSTTGIVNTTRPSVAALLPILNQADVDVAQNVRVTFDVPMRSSTLSNRFMGLVPRPVHELWYRVRSEDSATDTTAVIEHGLFRDYQENTTPQDYYPVINNEVTTAYQICFYPAYGVPVTSCGEGNLNSTSPSCCNGTATASGACPLPPATPL